MEKRTIDIGCGLNKEYGAVGLDKVAEVNPDILHDLEVFPYPIADGSFDRILVRHVVEHVGDIVHLIEEIHRIAKPGASVEIITPHYSSSNSWTDPTHKNHLGFFSFEFFCGEEGRVRFYTQVRFKIESKHLDFHKRYKLLGFEWFANKFPRTWEKYYCFMLPARNMHINMRVIK